MRTWLALSCLAVTLLVVTAGSEKLHSRVTKELLQKLLRMTKEEDQKKPITAGNLRERIGRVLHKVHSYRDEQKGSSLSKLVALLKKSLQKKQPDPEQKPNEVLGKPIEDKPVPKVEEPVYPVEEHSIEEFDEPIEVLEGGDLVEIDDSEALYQYFLLELFSSKTFCTKPVDQESVESVGALMTDLANDLITALESTMTALEAAEGAEEIVQAIANELFGAFEKFKEKDESVTAEGTALLFRYILYGTTESTHCEIGDEMYDWGLGESKTISNRYDRMACIAAGQMFFHVFMSDPFNPEWTSDTEFSENRCHAAFTLVSDTNPNDELDALVDAVMSDLECIVNKLKAAINSEEEAKKVMKRQDMVMDADLQKDPLAQAIEAMVEKNVEITTDLTQLIYTILMSNPLPDEGVEEKRTLMKSLFRMTKRHHK